MGPTYTSFVILRSGTDQIWGGVENYISGNDLSLAEINYKVMQIRNAEDYFSHISDVLLSIQKSVKMEK